MTLHEQELHLHVMVNVRNTSKLVLCNMYTSTPLLVLFTEGNI